MGHRYPSWRTFNSGQHVVDNEKLTTSDIGPKHPAERAQGGKSKGLGTALPREEEDHTLISECCAGHTQAFNRLVFRHQNSVSTLATRLLRDPCEAEDVTQDTFLRAYERIEEFRGEAKFSTWLYRICHNLCLNHLKRKKTDPTNNIGDKALPEELAAPRNRLPDQMLIRKEQQHLVKQAFAHMTQEFREVLVLHHTAHLSYEEIAETLGLPVGTVRSRLHRGREEIKEHLRPYL
jgi:RNA polymerase sigma-70 factor, ECF subfamily